MLNLILSVLGAITALGAGSGYIWSIVNGHTRPSRVTWGGWSLVGVLGLVSSTEGGAGIGLIVAATLTVLVVITFALSLKYGKKGGNQLDYLLGVVAAAALLLRLAVDYSPSIAATIAVIADFIFLWPTLKGAWFQPYTEPLWPWAAGVLAVALGIAALGNYSYAASAYSIYILIADSLVMGALIIKRPKRAQLPLKRSLSKSARR